MKIFRLRENNWVRGRGAQALEKAPQFGQTANGGPMSPNFEKGATLPSLVASLIKKDPGIYVTNNY